MMAVKPKRVGAILMWILIQTLMYS